MSYSIAEEGSNNLYIAMIETMITKRDPSTYDIVEIEMILNYFPHYIWSSEDQLAPLRSRFYESVLGKVEEQVSIVDNRQFIALF